MIRRRHTARTTAMRLAACALALFAGTSHAEGPRTPISVARVTEGLYAVLAPAGGEVVAEQRVPIFTLTLPLAVGAVSPMQLGAHMTVGNQPRRSSAIVFSTVVPF